MLTQRTLCANRSLSTGATADGRVFECEIVDERPGMAVLQVRGRDARNAFAHESGGHRWQRVPPTEKRGRRHTSTVTVAVMPVLDVLVQELSARDIEWKATRGSGAGGQAKNKTSNAVQMTHLPTGVSVRVETSRSQWENRQTAARLLAARLVEHAFSQMSAEEASYRRTQIGSGQRGDKIRTIRLQDDQVTDHRSGRTISAAKYLKGEIGLVTGETS